MVLLNGCLSNILPRIKTKTHRAILKIEDSIYEALVLNSRENQSAARTTFLNWLRHENQVFHISGKPGSGKSTLMKLLLDHPQTLVELKQWAGDKQLVFAHFFFWKSGDKMQRSLSGLYRSILFETLKQCPDLIRDIFPDAYDVFSNNGPGYCIDELFFRTEDLARGMQNLISRSQYPGYRFCLFIDGLDEYGEDGVDGLDREKLAENLESWAANDDIKILVSSRPHREFQQAFSDSYRIKLHDLTKPDIWLFGQSMFENDKNFTNIQHFYIDLIGSVVDSSYGVFLWARLAFRSLIMATRRSTALDYLKKQLDGVPKDLNKLYEDLLGSINPADREKTFKMLLLVSELGLVNSIAWTWLEQLDDPNFPTSYDICPYSDDEIAERQGTATSQVDDFAKGLLDITDSPYYEGNPFLEKNIQFFHRTLQDFVRESEQMRKFSAEYPEFLGHDIKLRLDLAEHWFAKTEYIRDNYAIATEFASYPKGPMRDARLDAFEKVMSSHSAINGKTMSRFRTYPSLSYMTTAVGQTDTTFSFLHWVIHVLDDAEYVCPRLAENSCLLQAQDSLSIMISASLIFTLTGTVLKALLDLGLSPNERVSVSECGLPGSRTVWEIFSIFFAARMLRVGLHHKGWKTEACKRLELFLATLTVNADCLILLAQGSSLESYQGGPTHIVSLRQLVVQLKPVNQATLLQLIDGPGMGMFATLQTARRSVISAKSEPPPSTAALLPFDINAQRSAWGEDMFFIHSVKWRDGTQIHAKDLKVRVF